MEKKILIEKKTNLGNAWQNQTRIDTGEASGANWLLRILYIPEPELT